MSFGKLSMKQNNFNFSFVDLIKNKKTSNMDEVLLQIKDGPRLGSRRAIEIYQEDYEARLTGALKNTYRSINYFIGDELFHHLATDYIKKYNSQSPNLDDYGEYLSDLIKNHQLNNDYIFLSELADFEWNFREIFHLEQVPGVDHSALSLMLTNHSAKICLVKSARLLNYNHSITSLYELKDKNLSNDDFFDFKIPEYILMIKNNLLVSTFTLSFNQWKVMANFLTPVSPLEIFQNNQLDITPGEIQSLFHIIGTNRLLI